MEFGIALFWLVVGAGLVLFVNKLARESEARDCYTSQEEDLIEETPTPLKDENEIN